MFAVTAASALVALSGQAALMDWRLAPTAEEVARVHPDAAARQALEGRAVLACRLAKSGALQDCVVEQEEPSGEGFGKAALRLQTFYKAAVNKPQVRPLVDTIVQTPIQWRLPATPIEPVLATAPRLPTGKAELSCRLLQGRQLDNCNLVSEAPADAGLGKAAFDVVSKMNSASNFETLPAAKPVRVLVPIHFNSK
jgi:hypothetical protein